MIIAAAKAMAISSSLSSVSATSSLRDDIKQIGLVFFSLFLVCTCLVIVGVILEEVNVRTGKSYVDEVTGAFIPEKRRDFTKLGLWLLVIGITGEGLFEIADGWIDRISEEFSNSLLHNAEALTGDAAKSARTAHNEADAVKGIADEARTDAKDALSKGRAALNSLKQAESDAAKAQDISSSALNRATEAESHLNDSLQLSKELTKELERVTSPRRLAQFSKMADPLKAFKDTEYVFVSVAADKEALDFLIKIDELLKQAGWKRGPSVSGVFDLLVKGQSDPTFSVPTGLTIGVHVSVQSTVPQRALSREPRAMWPKHVLAATTINTIIFNNTLPTPREADGSPVEVSDGTAETVFISVGKKPY